MEVIRRFIKKKRIECFQGFFSQFRYWKETRCNEACYRWKCDIRKTLDTFRNDRFECKWAMEAHNGTRAPCMPRPPCPEIHDTKVGFQFSYANSTPASIRMEFLFEMRFIRFTCTRNEDAQARIIFLLKIESRIPRLAKYSSMHPRYTRNTDRTIRIKNDSDESRFWTMPWKRKKKEMRAKEKLSKISYRLVSLVSLRCRGETFWNLFKKEINEKKWSRCLKKGGKKNFDCTITNTREVIVKNCYFSKQSRFQSRYLKVKFHSCPKEY